MNSLEIFCDLNEIEPDHAMNLLQDVAVISDLCVHASDVAEEDQPAAIAYLQSLL